MVSGIKFTLHENLYIRDPQETELGRKILKEAIELMYQIGLENFTFKKLAIKISSAERSIYRYFENKHFLLLFLTSWYWEWVHYLISISIQNVDDPQDRLNKAIENIVLATSENTQTDYINENLLHKLVIKEGSKAYHTIAVDRENKVGLYASYKQLTQTISQLILDVNPKFPYASSFASSLFEMSNNQIYFAEHLPRLSSLEDNQDKEVRLIEMLQYFSDKLLQ